MKKITSTTGKDIRFRADGTTMYILKPKAPTYASDEHARVIRQRLGAQVKIEDGMEPTPKNSEDTVDDKEAEKAAKAAEKEAKAAAKAAAK